MFLIFLKKRMYKIYHFYKIQLDYQRWSRIFLVTLCLNYIQARIEFLDFLLFNQKNIFYLKLLLRQSKKKKEI